MPFHSSTLHRVFCPLCQSEFRDGFTECADCHVALVKSRAAAKAASARVWKGITQHSLDKILAALDSANIRSRYKEIVNVGPRFWIFGIPIGRNPITFEYELWVFRKDLTEARQVIQQIN